MSASLSARLGPRQRLLFLVLAAVVALVWAPSALGDATATATDPGTAQPVTTAGNASTGTGTAAATPVGDPSATAPTSTDGTSATTTGGTGQTANEHTPATGGTTAATGGGTTQPATPADGATTTPADSTSGSGTGTTGATTGATTAAATTGGTAAATTSTGGTTVTPADAAAATALPVKPDTPPPTVDHGAKLDGPDQAPAPAPPVASRPDPVAAAVQSAPARGDVPDAAGPAPAHLARQSPAGGPDARPAARVARRDARAAAALRMAPLAREPVVHASSTPAATAAAPDDPAPDPVARKFAPRLGASAHAPRASALGVNAFALMPPLSGQTAAAGGLLQILAGYFAPPGGNGTHMILFAELALIGAALGLGIFRAPLLRLVVPDGRRRAGYQAVALRPG